MVLIYRNSDIFIRDINCRLGSRQWTLEELNAAQMLSNVPADLARAGYATNFLLGEGETLGSLAGSALSATLAKCPSPKALIFHHTCGENMLVPRNPGDRDLMAWPQYFPAALMRQLKIDHVPYVGSFATGCAGFLSLMITGAGLLIPSKADSVVCLTGDTVPPGATCDAKKEKFMMSDSSSAFVMERSGGDYQLLGINYYSITRQVISVVEITKRIVQLARELLKELALDMSDGNAYIHYPNLFAPMWDMVSKYLGAPRERQVLEDMSERGHCLSSDSPFTLSKPRPGGPGTMHVVINYGAGLHMGVAVFKQTKSS
jgi:hypothetical protein